MKKNFFSLSFLLLLFYLSACNNSNTGTTSQNETLAVPEVKSAFINGDSIHYIDIGKGDPVVFVHGSWGDYRTWEAQIDEFAKHYRVIAYSRRFAYPNEQIVNDSADYSVTAHAKDLAEFLKALKLEPVHLVGHSFGAFAALLTTIDHPGLVRSLTLGEPPILSLLQNVQGGDTLINNFIEATMPAAEAFKNNNEEIAAKIFIAAVMDDASYFSRMPQRAREIMMANSLETRGYLLGKTAFPLITCNDLKQIKTPVLLLKGDKSPRVLTSAIDVLDSCLTNKEKTTLPNTSHGLEYESPAEFNKVVLAFLDEH